MSSTDAFPFKNGSNAAQKEKEKFGRSTIVLGLHCSASPLVVSETTARPAAL